MRISLRLATVPIFWNRGSSQYGRSCERGLGNTYSMMGYHGSIVLPEMSELDLNPLKVYEKGVSAVETSESFLANFH